MGRRATSKKCITSNGGSGQKRGLEEGGKTEREKIGRRKGRRRLQKTKGTSIHLVPNPNPGNRTIEENTRKGFWGEGGKKKNGE